MPLSEGMSDDDYWIIPNFRPPPERVLGGWVDHDHARRVLAERKAREAAEEAAYLEATARAIAANKSSEAHSASCEYYDRLAGLNVEGERPDLNHNRSISTRPWWHRLIPWSIT
jgi:hypothetical protein